MIRLLPLFRSRSMRLSTALLIGTAAPILSVLPAAAQTSPTASVRNFSIPAQPLVDAMREFSRTTDIQVVYTASVDSGVVSSAVAGSLSPVEALSRLLAGTGLTYRFTGASAVTLEPAPRAEAETVQLGPVRVEADGSSLRGSGRWADLPETATGPVSGYVASRTGTATKTDTPLREVPQSISVVTRDAMDARAVSNVTDSLEYVAGFTPFAYSNDIRGDWAIVRGMGQTQGLLYRDGLKDGNSNYYATARITSYGLERVEYLRGPASILYGANVPGGLINAVTKRPMAIEAGEVRLRGGSRDRLGLAGDINTVLNGDDTVLFRLVGLGERQDLRTPGVRADEYYVAPALTFNPSASTSITVLAHYRGDRIRGSHSYQYPEAIGYFVDDSDKAWDRFDRDTWSAGFILDHRFSDQLSLHSRLRYTRTTLDYRTTGQAGLVSDTTIARYAQWFKDRTNILHSDSYLNLKWNVGVIENSTIVGVDISQTKGFLYYGEGASTNLNFATGQTSGQFETPVLAETYLGNARQYGVYLQNQMKIAETLVVLAGLRNDWYKDNVTGAWAGPEVRQSKVTGRVGAVLLLAEGFSPYASYATSFEPTSGVTFGGAAFKPTTGRQFELGMKYEPLGGNARLTLALFDIKQNNVLVADPDHEFFSIQRGQIGSKGVEFEANASLPGGFDVTASYTYTDAKVLRNTDPSAIGLRNGSVARHRFTLWADWKPRWEGLDGFIVGAGVRANSRTPNYANTRWEPSLALFDARLGYQTSKWEFAVNARNLLDKDYNVARNFGNVYPGEKREVIATMTHRW